MKKFLKRTVAVLLTVCLMASFLVPVSAAEVSEYTFAKSGVTLNKGVTANAPTGFGSWTGYSNQKIPANNYGLTGLVGKGVFLVLKLSDINAVAGNKYDITFNYHSNSVEKTFIYLMKGDTVIDNTSATTLLSSIDNVIKYSEEENLGDNSVTKLGSYSDSPSATISSIDLSDYLYQGSFYVVIRGSGETNSRFTLKSISVEGVESAEAAKTAAVSVDYNTAWGDYLGKDKIQIAEENQGYLETMADGLGSDLNVAYVGDNLYWTTGTGLYLYNNVTDARVKNFNGISLQPKNEGDYFVLKIAAPNAGTYTLSVDAAIEALASTSAEFFFIPASVVTNAQTQITGLIADSTYSKGIVNLKADTADFEEIEIDADEDYYYVVVRTNVKKRVYLSGFSLTSTNQYADLASAAAAATTEFHTVKLLKDSNEGINVNGYTLDLNGFTVTGNVIATNGSVIDSTDGTGSVTGSLVISGANNGYIPLKDGANWRIFNCDGVVTFCDGAATMLDNPVVSGENVLMWFDLHFTNAAAYTLIASGNSGLSVGAALSVNDTLLTDDIVFAKTVKGWAGADHAAGDQAMGLQIANAAAAGQGGKITVVFSYETDAGAASQIDYTGLTYTVPTAE